MMLPMFCNSSHANIGAVAVSVALSAASAAITWKFGSWRMWLARASTNPERKLKAVSKQFINRSQPVNWIWIHVDIDVYRYKSEWEVDAETTKMYVCRIWQSQLFMEFLLGDTVVWGLMIYVNCWTERWDMIIGFNRCLFRPAGHSQTQDDKDYIYPHSGEE